MFHTLGGGSAKLWIFPYFFFLNPSLNLIIDFSQQDQEEILTMMDNEDGAMIVRKRRRELNKK